MDTAKRHTLNHNLTHVEISPNISIIDNQYPNTEDSHVLITLVEKGVVSSHHYVNGEVSQISTEHVIQSLEQEASHEVKSKKLTITSKLFLYSGYALAVFLFLFSLSTFTGVVKARVVLTGSMSPAISTGDVIITTPLKYKTPRKGDVIAYQAKRFNGAPVGVFSHRIVGGDVYSGFIVKGDNNKLPDSQRPTSRDILGTVIFVIPFIGNLLTPKALFLIVPTIFGFYLIVDSMRNVE